MQILNSVTKVAPEVSWKEFAVKFPIVFLICIPLPMIGLALLGYHLSESVLGITKGGVPALMTLAGCTFGAIIGFAVTLFVIKAGHKD